MMLYWGPNSVPELHGLEKRKQSELFQTTLKEGMKRLGGFKGMLTTYWWLLLLIIVPFFVVRVLSIHGGIRLLVFAIVTVFVALFLGNRCIDKGREWLREQGYPKR